MQKMDYSTDILQKFDLLDMFQSKESNITASK